MLAGMFEFRLILIRPEDKRLVLRFSLVLRAVFFTLSLVTIAAMAVSGSAAVLGIILAAATLLGAVLEERWTWDPAARTLTHRSGLLFLARSQTYTAADIAGLELRRYYRNQVAGQPGPNSDTAKRSLRRSLFSPRMIGLGLDTAGGRVPVENHREREKDDLALFATLLAEALDKPLEEMTQD
jgi:hypothetical protein